MFRKHEQLTDQAQADAVEAILEGKKQCSSCGAYYLAKPKRGHGFLPNDILVTVLAVCGKCIAAAYPGNSTIEFTWEEP